MEQRLVLGLDPSTCFGVCVASESGKVVYTKEISYPKLFGFERISAILADVLDVYKMFKPSKVVVEGMIVGHAASAISVIQVATLLRYFLWQENIPYMEVSPSTLKKFVCGSGNAKKEQVMMWVSKRYGFESPTNNIADAVGLAMVGVCSLSGKGTLEQLTIVQGLMFPAPKSRSKRSK